MTVISRRTFFKSAGLGLAVAGTAPNLFGAAQPGRWPVGCRDVYLKTTGLHDPWEAMKALKAECIDVVVDTSMNCPNIAGQKACNIGSGEGIQSLKEDLRASGCQISAFVVANRFDQRLEEDLRWTGQVVKAADALGVKAIRIDVVPRKLSASEFLPFAISTCRRLCDLAAGTSVRFGVENHSTTTNDPEFLRKLFEGVGSSKLGLTLDIANFYWWGHPEKNLYALYEEFAPRAVHTHMKNIRYPEHQRNAKRPMGWEYSKYAVPIYEGDIDIKRVVGILKKAGYGGDLCVEDETLGNKPREKQEEIVRREIQFLKELE